MAQVLLSIGSNIDKERHIRSALTHLREQFGAFRWSSVYESEAVGFAGESFYNLAAQIHTDLTPAALNELLHQIEYDNGRRRDGSKKFGPRTLDIDILTYDDLCGEQAAMRLPRDEILSYAFVLLPLAELVPEQLHPQLQKSYAELWQAFTDKAAQPLSPIEFNWP